MKTIEILNLLRIKDWLKNIIIFFPIVFSGLLSEYSNYTHLLIGFIFFSIVSSIIYIINDILDIEVDRLHPTKKFSKPLASGTIKLNFAYLVLIFLSIVSFSSLIFLPSIIYNLILYLLLSLAYNFYFKRIPIIELIILSLGYVIRIDAGSTLIKVESSISMIVATFFLAMFFLTIKRLSELNQPEISLTNLTRDVLKFYKKIYLKFASLICGLILILILILYAIHNNMNLLISIFIISVFLFRYYYLARNNTSGENPINFIFKYKSLLFLSILSLFFILIFYF